MDESNLKEEFFYFTLKRISIIKKKTITTILPLNINSLIKLPE